MFVAYHQTCQPTISSSTVSTSRRADALPRLEASPWSAKEDLDTTGGRGSPVHNRLAGSLVVEVAMTFAGQAQQWVSEYVFLYVFIQKYVLSISESVQCNFFIFDHVTFIQFKIYCCVHKFYRKRMIFRRDIAI